MAAAIILARLRVISRGSLEDRKSVGKGVSELRIFFGPGYRLYYTVRDKEIVLLLVGGDKKSQPRDIALAKEMASMPTIDCEDILEDDNEDPQS